MARTRSCLLAAAILSAQSLNGALIVVDTLDDENNSDGDCSLREAVIAANLDDPRDGCASGAGHDLVLIGPTGTIDLSLGPLMVTRSLEVYGLPGLVVDAGHRSRIFHVAMTTATDDFRIAGGMTLSGGSVSHPLHGGALYVRSADVVTLEDVRFEGNRTCSSVTAGTCTFDADHASSGGAVYIDPVDAVNRLRIIDAVFEGNHAAGTGGAIAIGSTSNGGLANTDLELVRSDFLHNVARTVAGAVRWSTNRPIWIDRVAAVGNRTDGFAGAFWLSSTAYTTIHNSLLADNEARSAGAISKFDGDGEMWYSTIVGNRSLEPAPCQGAMWLWSPTFEIQHSLIANNDGGDCCGHSYIQSNGFNQDSNDTCGFDHSSDLPSGPVETSGVGYWFGNRPAVLPASDSSLVDAGPAGSCPGPTGTPATVDLVGNVRPVDAKGLGDELCDIGAIEVPVDSPFLFGDGFESGSWSRWSSATP